MNVDDCIEGLLHYAPMTATEFAAGEEVAAPTDEAIMAACERAAAGRGVASTRLVSGAGHDAQVLALLGPIGMLFVPSRGGVSHSPQEHTGPSLLVTGAEVLLDTVRMLDCGPPEH